MNAQSTPLHNALQAAIIDNGLAKPMSQQERIWRAVKDMQPVQYSAVAKRTGLKATSVSSVLGAMEKRGMVYSRGAKGKGPIGKCREYMTDLTDYKLLPKPNEVPRPHVQLAPKPKTPIMVANGVDIDAVQFRKNVTQSNSISALAHIDTLTVAQARELWAVLNKMFGGVK